MNSNILCLIDSFKGSITSKDISIFLNEFIPNLTYFPISDGGENFLDSIKFIYKYKYGYDLKGVILKNISFLDNQNKKINIKILINEKEKVAYLESSLIIGLNLIDDLNNPSVFKRTSKGLGEVLLKINSLNIRKIYIGLGGSALSEMGLGLLKVLGVKFFSKENIDITKNINFLIDLEKYKVNSLSFRELLKLNYEIILINDVSNPLTGQKGANFIYAPQKGASINDLSKLDDLFRKFKALINNDFTFHLKDDEVGDGSAGGLGFIFKHVLNARYIQGIDYFLSLIDFKNIANKYDFIITGEGSLDNQSFNKKVVGGILDSLDETFKNKIIIITGINNLDLNSINKKYKEKIYKIYSLYPNFAKNKKESISNPKKYLKKLIIELDKDVNI